VDVRVVVWEGESTLTVPLTALFRRDDGWALFVAEDGIARIRSVKPEHRAGLAVEIVEGVSEGERVILNPGDGIEDGTRVQVRQRRD
jgi:HlyD family secretion protein